MYVRRLFFPAAATLARASAVRGLALTPSRGAQQQLISRASHSSSSSSSSNLSLHQETTIPTRRARQLLSQRARGGSSSSSMATTAGGCEIRELKTAQDVLDFWFGGDVDRLASDKEYGQSYGAKWFGFGEPDEAFIGTQNHDASKELIRKAASGELKGEQWESPNGALARLLLLDQFPRTAYRGTSRAFAHDEMAASLALEVVAKGWDTADAKNYAFVQRTFVYLPLMHSEKMEAQDTCVAKCKELMDEETAATGAANSLSYQYALNHREVVERFGRFPHRNAALGRESTPEELEWLNSDDIPDWAKSQRAPSAA